jgi:hypothetical protein
MSGIGWSGAGPGSLTIGAQQSGLASLVDLCALTDTVLIDDDGIPEVTQ